MREKPDASDASSQDASAESDAGPMLDRPKFCARGSDDIVATLFCRSDFSSIDSLGDLNQRLKFFYPVMLSHTTGLGARFVSAINPRLLASSGFIDSPESSFAMLAFSRGQQRVELIALDAKRRRFHMYLVEFKQACNTADDGCRPRDLFTPAIEDTWLELTVRDDEQLKNTPEDCRRCHGGGPGQRGPMLLMRELLGPWTHWFNDLSPHREIYRLAKRDEAYGGFTLGSVIPPGALEQRIEAAERDDLQPAQPLLFPSLEIAFETGEGASSGLTPGAEQEPGVFKRSPTWQDLYDAFRRGEAPAPPYQYDRAADRDKLQARAISYTNVMLGRLPADQFPDLSDVFPDDPQTLAELGFGVEPGASGPELLIQACYECHHQGLDPTLSRARFDIDLTRVGRAGIESAIDRLELADDDPKHMPPAGFRSLTPDARVRLLDFLRSKAVLAVEH